MELRTGQTHAENLLWKKIRRKQLKGRQFLRQRPIGHFVVDFLCMELHLIVEVGGLIHGNLREKDLERQRKLESLGFRVLRFSNEEVEKDMYHVIQTIYQYI